MFTSVTLNAEFTTILHYSYTNYPKCLSGGIVTHSTGIWLDSEVIFQKLRDLDVNGILITT